MYVSISQDEQTERNMNMDQCVNCSSSCKVIEMVGLGIKDGCILGSRFGVARNTMRTESRWGLAGKLQEGGVSIYRQRCGQ